MPELFPATIGSCIDLLYQLREERLDKQKVVDAISSNEEKLRAHIIDSFQKVDIEGARGQLASASVNPRRKASVKDWEALQKYIIEHGAFDLLQRRPNDKAYVDRVDAGEVIPGVETFVVLNLSLTRR